MSPPTRRVKGSLFDVEVGWRGKESVVGKTKPCRRTAWTHNWYIQDLQKYGMLAAGMVTPQNKDMMMMNCLRHGTWDGRGKRQSRESSAELFRTHLNWEHPTVLISTHERVYQWSCVRGRERTKEEKSETESEPRRAFSHLILTDVDGGRKSSDGLTWDEEREMAEKTRSVREAC